MAAETVPETMSAVLLTAHGGPEVLEYRDDVRVPAPGPDEVLIRVAAAGVNNTDINTRIGWYAKSVSSGTGGAEPVGAEAAGGWAGDPLVFPRIQGADACGHIVRVGAGVDPARLGERVLVATIQRGWEDAAVPRRDAGLGAGRRLRPVPGGQVGRDACGGL